MSEVKEQPTKELTPLIVLISTQAKILVNSTEELLIQMSSLTIINRKIGAMPRKQKKQFKRILNRLMISILEESVLIQKAAIALHTAIENTRDKLQADLTEEHISIGTDNAVAIMHTGKSITEYILPRVKGKFRLNSTEFELKKVA